MASSLEACLILQTARNVLLFTLLIDDEDGSKNGAIWNIYYHLHLDRESYHVLQDQSEKLYALSSSIESWHQSKYGAILKICDAISIAGIRKTWKSYCIERMKGESYTGYESCFDSSLRRAKETRKARLGNGYVYTGFRSSAPVSLHSLEDLPRLHQHFWDTGTMDGRDIAQSAAHPNPTFATAVKDGPALHYGTDPLLGFHLGTAYAPLLPESPLGLNSSVTPDLDKVVEAAKVQFRAWSNSFRGCLPTNMTIRFFTGDALAFCYALQHQRISADNSPANLYRDPFHSEPLILNDGDDDRMDDAPSTFNVIDTSNLYDHLGPLNVLVACSPLLSDELSATLYTESLVKREDSLRSMSDELLCGHFPTISILLGLFPVEYWTNASAISTVDEAMFNHVRRMTGNSEGDAGQMHCRLAWKRAPAQLVSTAGPTRSPLRFDNVDLARILFQVYQKIFQHENMDLLFSCLSLQRLRNNSHPRYHRGSLAAFLALVKRQNSADWDKVMEGFLELIENDCNSLMGRNYIQELYLYLHLLGIYSVPPLRPNSDIEWNNPNLDVSKDNSSAVVCITLKVPRNVLKVFAKIPHTELGTPIIHCILQSSPQFTGRPWQNIFSVVQLAFGNITTTGSMYDDNLKLTINNDEDGWMGVSSLFASFYVPRWITCLEPHDAVVLFGIQNTPQTSRTFTVHFGLELNIYETHLGNKENVYVTRHSPNQSGRPRIHHLSTSEVAIPKTVRNLFSTTITAVLDIQTVRITALKGRVDLKSQDAQTLLRDGAEIETIQTSACVITILIGTTLRYELCFPAPVMRSRSKLRLARKSSYIEVVAPIASPMEQDLLQHFMYPSFIDISHPVSWNMPRLFLDRLPMLDTTKTGNLQWLITHTSLMFSTRERTLRQTSMNIAGGIHSNARLNYKESLFSMFMSFSGLQGTKSKVFGLSDSTRGGVSILILGFRLRLDLANHTVVLDAAVLPLTTRLVPRIQAFLEAISAMRFPVINMNDDEMKLWKQTISACVERCRDWSHTLSCEYLTNSCIPISFESHQDFLCSCGKGRFPTGYMPEIPRWKMICEHSLRIALSPSFSVPYVEGVCESDDRRLRNSDVSVCDACGKDKTSSGTALLKCARCQTTKYCSVECQRAQWKLHKGTCRKVVS